ncbi:alpha/beta hydrolase [Trueperella bialowiezensis]|uniref:Phospholipase ytpA n=1 Tax=Trueperella bialowiezensis TaxID=312285 RepID=A0A448PFF3_9ACTO|nr:alpha/beta hydrolase [Trueperella bialowiezensis]VEI13643.1 Phospholipase ytpA [Trueperella bialowiezensis]
MTWIPDPLGAGFYHRFISLHDDQFGPNRACLVTYLPDQRPVSPSPVAGAAPVAVPRPKEPFAVLALHGWNDYFYHYEFAHQITALGGHFYALDLRKYGRAHLEGQMWGYVEDLSTYDEEISAALDLIYDAHGLGVPVFLYGHSTGGLTATLWANRHPGVLRGLVLNSPWLELQAATAVRQAGQPLLDALHKMVPTAALPISDDGFYQRLVTGWMSEEERAEFRERQHAAGQPDDADPFFREGGWNPNPDYRHYPTFPIRPGWLRAILNGHEKVAGGLAIDCPILVLTSARTHFSDTWSDAMRRADTVLDVEQIWKRVPGLGAVTTLVKLEDAIHDVLLSRGSVCHQAYWHIGHFLGQYLGA